MLQVRRVSDRVVTAVLQLRRVSDRVVTAVLVFEEDVLRLICGYAVQSGRTLEEKQSFYDKLIGEWDMYFAVDLFMCLGDINGHIGN